MRARSSEERHYVMARKDVCALLVSLVLSLSLTGESGAVSNSFRLLICALRDDANRMNYSSEANAVCRCDVS